MIQQKFIFSAKWINRGWIIHPYFMLRWWWHKKNNENNEKENCIFLEIIVAKGVGFLQDAIHFIQGMI